VGRGGRFCGGRCIAPVSCRVAITAATISASLGSAPTGVGAEGAEAVDTPDPGNSESSTASPGVAIADAHWGMTWYSK